MKTINYVENENGVRYISESGEKMDIFEKLGKDQFEREFPDVNVYDLEQYMPVYLDNGVVLIDTEWNGEFYSVDVKGEIKHFVPVYKDNGEDADFDIVGYYER